MKINDITERIGQNCHVRGRVLAKRRFGKLVFLDLADDTGKVQLSITPTADGTFEEAKNHIGIWDIIDATGDVYFTRTNTKTLNLQSCSLIIPFQGDGIDKYHGINNYGADGRVQQIIFDRTLFDMLKTRALIVKSARSFLDNQGFLEMETPLLVEEDNLSKAASFSTHCDGLETTLYLRKTPEQNLKKLIIGGFDAVYELGKDFRNEAVSKYFQPEFTVLEAYQAHQSYNSMQTLLLNLVNHIESSVALPRSLTTYESYEFSSFMGADDFPQSQAEIITQDFRAKTRNDRNKTARILPRCRSSRVLVRTRHKRCHWNGSHQPTSKNTRTERSDTTKQAPVQTEELP